MTTKCPKCEAVVNVAGGYDRQISIDPQHGSVNGTSIIRVICHECNTEFTPIYNGVVNY